MKPAIIHIPWRHARTLCGIETAKVFGEAAVATCRRCLSANRQPFKVDDQVQIISVDRALGTCSHGDHPGRHYGAGSTVLPRYARELFALPATIRNLGDPTTTRVLIGWDVSNEDGQPASIWIDVENLGPVRFTPADIAQAEREGWNLFEAHGVLEIERDDERGTFDDDDAAMRHVQMRAAAGDPTAQRALILHGQEA